MPDLVLSQEMSAGPARLRVDVLGGPSEREGFLEQLEHVDEVRADDRVAADADAG